MVSCCPNIYNWTGLSSANMDTLVSHLSTQGIREVILVVNGWSDGGDGVLSSTYVNQITALGAKLNAAGISYHVDLHSWHNSGTSTYMAWNNFWNSTYGATRRASWEAYIEDAIDKLDDLSGLMSYQVLNEPEYESSTQTKCDWIVSLCDLAHGLTAKDISVRFMGGASPWDVGSSYSPHYEELDDSVLDYFCINAYCHVGYNIARWNCDKADIEAALSAAHADGKELWITEQGQEYAAASTTPPWGVGTEEAQRYFHESWVTYANAQGIDKICAWSVNMNGTNEMNLYNGTTRRPAYYELVSSPLVGNYYLSYVYGKDINDIFKVNRKNLSDITKIDRIGVNS